MSSDRATVGSSGVGEEGRPNTLLNALIGFGASVVLFFLPMQSVVGGAIAGYLQGPDLREGAKVGAIAGVVASLSVFGLFVVVVLGLAIVDLPAAVGGFGFLIVMLAVFASVAYVIGGFALGGVLGSWVKREGIVEDL